MKGFFIEMEPTRLSEAPRGKHLQEVVATRPKQARGGRFCEIQREWQSLGRSCPTGFWKRITANAKERLQAPFLPPSHLVSVSLIECWWANTLAETVLSLASLGIEQGGERQHMSVDRGKQTIQHRDKSIFSIYFKCIPQVLAIQLLRICPIEKLNFK